MLLSSELACACAKANGGVTDWKAVEKNVAASEPPRVTDIPSHSKFLKLFGGKTTDHHYLADTMAYLNLHMPEGRIIPGTFLDKISSLKFKPSKMMPRMAHACLITQACGKKDKEKIGCTLTEGHVKSLTGDRETIALEAEQILGKAHELKKQLPHDQYQQGVDACGQLAEALCMHIFELDDTFDTLADISTMFVEQLCMGKRAASTTDEAASAAASATVVFTEEGVSNAGKITVGNLGFSKGDLIEPKKSTDNKDEQYLIAYVNDDGSVGVRAIDLYGKECSTITIIKMDALVAQYKTTRKRIELYKDYPDNTILVAPKYQEYLSRAALTVALNTLANDGKFQEVTSRSQRFPKERLFVEKAVPEGKLRLVPVTHKIVDPSSIKDGEAVKDPKTAVWATVGSEKFQLNRAVGDEFVSEFFIMRVVNNDKKQCSMQLKFFEETVKVAKNTTIAVKAPCAVNVADVDAGDELVLSFYIPKKEPKQKEVTIAMDPKSNASPKPPPTKRARK